MVISKLNSLAYRLSRPLRAIEQVIAGLVITSFLIVVWIVHESPDSDAVSLLHHFSDRYVGVAWLLGIMSLFAAAQLICTWRKETARNLEVRTMASFINVVGFLFLSILVVTYDGWDNALWINWLAISLISAPIYLALKVTQRDAG